MTTTMKHKRSLSLFPALVLAALCATAVGCGPAAVEPIGLHDSVVPIEARRFVADAEDGVAVARARLSDATRNQRNVEQWAEYIVEDLNWPPDRNLGTKLNRLVEARAKMAELELEYAEAELELAEAKLELVTAETAIRHDLAIYELEPLRERNDGALTRVGELGAQIEADQRKLEQITAEWWTAFGAFSQGGGDTAPFYLSAMPGASENVTATVAE